VLNCVVKTKPALTLTLSRSTGRGDGKKPCWHSWLFALLCVCCFGAVSPAAVEDGSDIRISILTMGPGDASWEKFGHIAIRIQDPRTNYPDVVFNWGMFDFEQKNFYINFIQGRMIYSTAAMESQPMIDEYRQSDRAVWEQVLHLSGEQKLDFKRRCATAVQPENRDYRYDYYRDNCSTRVRDMIDQVLGGELQRQTEVLATGHSYRWNTRRLVGGDIADIPLYVALQTALGHPVDQPISAWEEMFLPEKVREDLRRVTVVDADGQRVPLVESEAMLNVGDRPAAPAAPPRSIPPALAAGAALGAAIIGLTQLVVRGRRGARIALVLVAGAWLLLIGVGGSIIAWAWFGTDHFVAKYNENLLQVTPLALVLLAMLPRASGGGRQKAWIEAAIIAGLSLLGLALKATPFFFQVNGDMIALCLPVHLAIAWSMWRLTKLTPRAKAETKSPQRRTMRFIHKSIVLGLSGILLSGCGPSGPDLNARVTPAPPSVPAPPPPRNVPLDPGLAEAARQQISRSLNSTSPDLILPRVHALEALNTLGDTTHNAQVIAAFSSPEPIVRFAGAMTAGGLRLQEAHDALLAMAEDPDFSVRVADRYALHRLGDKRLSHDLEKYARDPRKEVRANTALVLGMLGEPSALKILRRLRQDDEPLVRQQADEAMWRLGDETGLGDLVALSVSRYPDDQMIALLALAEPRDQRVGSTVRAGLLTDYIEVKLVAARALGMLDSDEGYTIALQGAASTDQRQRFMAALALGAIGRSDAQETLRRLLADDYESVRIAAAQAILQLKPGVVKMN